MEIERQQNLKWDRFFDNLILIQNEEREGKTQKEQAAFLCTVSLSFSFTLLFKGSLQCFDVSIISQHTLWSVLKNQIALEHLSALNRSLKCFTAKGGKQEKLMLGLFDVLDHKYIY